MKTLTIKYLSLLLCSGLIIPFYYYNPPAQYLVKDDIKTVLHRYSAGEKDFSVIEYMASRLFPIIKKLK